MDYLIISFVVVLGNLITDFFFVLVLNPRRAANRIKSEILTDTRFQRDFMGALTTSDMLPIYDPVLEKLRQKLQGGLMHSQGQEALATKEIGKALLEDVK